VTGGATYCYRVRAYNTDGESGYAEACGTTLRFSGWTLLPGGGVTLAGPAVVILNGAPLVFARGTDNGIYQNFLTAGGWSGWSEVPGEGLIII
jgi:hypothetical protein